MIDDLLKHVLPYLHKIGVVLFTSCITAGLTGLATYMYSLRINRNNSILSAESQIFCLCDKLIRHAIEAERYQFAFRFFENAWLLHEHTQADLLKQVLAMGGDPTKKHPGIDMSLDIENHKTSFREFRKLSLKSANEYFLLKSELQKYIYELRRYKKTRANEINVHFNLANGIKIRAFDKEFISCKTMAESIVVFKALEELDQYSITKGIGLHLTAIMDIIDTERLSVNVGYTFK